MNTMQLARGLGWFSIGLGLAELIAPSSLSKLIGTPNRPGLMRAFGAREILSGVGALVQHRPVQSLWARVAGDVLDVSALGLALKGGRSSWKRVAATAAAVAGVAILDYLVATRLGDESPVFSAT